MDGFFQLWTYQGPGHSLTAGRIDHQKSPFWKSDEAIQCAYSKLHARIGTDQVIWCLLEERPKHWKGWHEWRLSVPQISVIAHLDQYAWNKILRKDVEYPSDWAHWGKRLSEDEWWELLLSAEPFPPKVANVLLRYPIPQAWVTAPARLV